MTLKIGDAAPDFAGEEQYGNVIRLSNYRGKWDLIMVFYTFDWNPINMLLMTDFQRNLHLFNELSMKVIAVSVDSVYSHKEWARRNCIEFPLISDFSKRISESYGVLDPRGFARPAIFVIDKKSIIKYSKLYLVGEKPSAEIIFEKIQELIETGEL